MQKLKISQQLNLYFMKLNKNIRFIEKKLPILSRHQNFREHHQLDSLFSFLKEGPDEPCCVCILSLSDCQEVESAEILGVYTYIDRYIHHIWFLPFRFL